MEDAEPLDNEVSEALAASRVVDGEDARKAARCLSHAGVKTVDGLRCALAKGDAVAKLRHAGILPLAAEAIAVEFGPEGTLSALHSRAPRAAADPWVQAVWYRRTRCTTLDTTKP